ncbi:hypothetical protein ACWDZX_38890, partial [Streptomyces collinus]
AAVGRNAGAGMLGPERLGGQAYVPFRAPGLALPTGLAVPAADPTPHLEKLLLACGDHEG